MKTIFEFPIKIIPEQEIQVPVGAEFIRIDLDELGQPTLWAIVESDNPLESVRLYAIAALRPISLGAIYLGSFLATTQVWHVFRSARRRVIPLPTPES